jgi:hypothetical protein
VKVIQGGKPDNTIGRCDCCGPPVRLIASGDYNTAESFIEMIGNHAEIWGLPSKPWLIEALKTVARIIDSVNAPDWLRNEAAISLWNGVHELIHPEEWAAEQPPMTREHWLAIYDWQEKHSGPLPFSREDLIAEIERDEAQEISDEQYIDELDAELDDGWGELVTAIMDPRKASPEARRLLHEQHRADTRRLQRKALKDNGIDKRIIQRRPAATSGTIRRCCGSTRFTPTMTPRGCTARPGTEAGRQRIPVAPAVKAQSAHRLSVRITSGLRPVARRRRFAARRASQV